MTAILVLFSVGCINIHASSLSTSAHEWGHLTSKNHKTPEAGKTAINWLNKYSGYYVGDTKEKVIYLTFDAGYENGYTKMILDILEKHKATACFFITKAMLDQNPKAVKRMVDEGFLVGNHTVRHIPFYKLSSDSIASELNGVAAQFRKITGKDLPKYMRPPEGGYSEKSLYVTSQLGYRTIMWSMDLPNDWNLKNQPTKESALSMVSDQSHNGAIPLLHAVSPVIAKNLDEMLTILEKQGYRFGSLTELK